MNCSVFSPLNFFLILCQGHAVISDGGLAFRDRTFTTNQNLTTNFCGFLSSPTESFIHNRVFDDDLLGTGLYSPCLPNIATALMGPLAVARKT